MTTNKILKYKDYIGSIEHSSEDRCFFGKILNIKDLVSYEGNTIEELEKSFKYMVNDYIETCKELSKN